MLRSQRLRFVTSQEIKKAGFNVNHNIKIAAYNVNKKYNN